MTTWLEPRTFAELSSPEAEALSGAEVLSGEGVIDVWARLAQPVPTLGNGEHE